jgi:PKD repeat protein
MKTNKINGIQSALLLAGLMALMSCEYKEIADADYSASKLYLPAAVTGIYKIENLTKENLATPTPGSTYRYAINKEANRFEIPLSVFRSGLNRSNAVNVIISANPDTAQSLINNGSLERTSVFPTGAYTVNETVTIADGSSVSPFTLNVDLGFLKNQAIIDRAEKQAALSADPDAVYISRKYALGITISNNDPNPEINPDLSTVIVLVDLRIFSPEAKFEYAADSDNPKMINFLNRSEFGVSCQWNFGDGGTSTETTPKHTYAQGGNYTVTIKVKGLLDDEVSYTETIEIK